VLVAIAGIHSHGDASNSHFNECVAGMAVLGHHRLQIVLHRSSGEWTVSVVSPKVISTREARQVMVSVLEMSGLSLEEVNGIQSWSGR
jgi:hypothetical protein